MKEQTLLRIALICSILGLAILYLISSSLELELTSVNAIDQSMKGTKVKIIGTVQSVRNTGEVQILTIAQPSSITVFVSSQTPLEKGNVVEVIGRVDEYKESQEIIADRIRTVS